ncbi:MAG: IS3 family transposase [Candidatus Halalkalibacterium sp. M3_1C_030]
MNRARYTVEKMSKLFGVSRSAYYEWLKQGDLKAETISIDKEVKEVFESSKKTYGSPRVYEELKEQGIKVSKSTVARRMRRLGLQARPRRRFIHTTDSKHEYKVFGNILNRCFTSERVNEKWVSDITYIATEKGWTYLTVILDLAERMIVGWTLSKDMSASNTTVAALKIALQRRSLKSGLVLHSDRGVQYCCSEFRKVIKKTKCIQQSMSRKGNCWDNAPAESFFKTLKSEWTNKFRYKNYDEAQRSIFDYIERWYNTKRKHSTLGYMSPLQKYYFLTQTAA